MACRVVCISRAEGGGGAEVGRLVAERLGFRYVDEEIVARAAAKGGISPADVADEERRKSTLSRLLQEIGRGSAIESYGLAGTTGPGESGTPDEIRSLIQEAIEETAGHGNVVIVSHAASFALPRAPDVLRVLVTAPPESRALRLSETRGMDERAAQKAIRNADAARADYLRRFHDVSAESPTHYDVVVNTELLTAERAAELLELAAS